MPRTKRKQRTYRKVRRVPKTAKRMYVDIQKQSSHPVVRAFWKNKKSILQNSSNFSVADIIDTLPDELYPHTPKKLTERESIVMANLYRKHKNNTQMMFRDIKVNVYQWTECQISNKLKLYLQKLETTTNAVAKINE